MEKDCNKIGGISSVSITEISTDKEFRKYSFNVPESERETHSFNVPITITYNKPTKPYWEMFGYKTKEDMWSAGHIHFGDYCHTCGTELKDCSLYKNDPADNRS